MDSNLKKLLEKLECQSGRLQLVQVEPISSDNENEVGFLRDMFKHKEKHIVIFATLLKTAIIQRRICFLLSKKELIRLVKSDPDNRYDNVNSKEYQTFIRESVGNQAIKYLIEPEDGFKMAILVKFTEDLHDVFFKFEDFEFYKEQINNSIKIYNQKLEKLSRKKEKSKKKEPIFK